MKVPETFSESPRFIQWCFFVWRIKKQSCGSMKRRSSHTLAGEFFTIFALQRLLIYQHFPLQPKRRNFFRGHLEKKKVSPCRERFSFWPI